MHPKVFISHASEDKQRFVLGFANRLRERGIDAWVDQWEINPGDSLVDKLFEEGLKNADAVVIVLSQFSVNKPWVREELNASFINRVQKQCKIVPVVIDDCEVPECLKYTVWERITNLESFDAEFGKIVNAICSHYEKPPLGTPPAYTRSAVPTLPGLTKTDSIVLKLVCDQAIEEGSFYGGPESIVTAAARQDITAEALDEALQMLESHGYLRGEYVLSGDMCLYEITTWGFAQYAAAHLQDYKGLLRTVALRLVNHDEEDTHTIAAALGRPELLVEHAFDVFEKQGYLQTIKPMGGGASAWDLKPALRRWLRETE